MKREKYSKIRLIISLAFGLLISFAIYHMIAEYFFSESESSFGGVPYKSEIRIYKEYFEGILFFVAPILFALNRKLTDYISFTMFIFMFGGLLSVSIADCSGMIGFAPCMKIFFWDQTSWLLLIMCSPLIYLTISLIKNIGKE